MRNLLLSLSVLLLPNLVSAETLKVYNQGKETVYEDILSTREAVAELATCDSFFVAGELNNNKIDKLSNLIKDNKSVLTIDMSEVSALDGAPFGTIEFSSLCSGLTSLQEFRFPAFSPTKKVYLDNLFDNCSSLKKVVNLEYYDKIYSMKCTFKDCVSLEEVTFSENENTTPDTYSDFKEVFSGCESLTSVKNFDKIHNVVGFWRAFADCVNLKELKLCSFLNIGKGYNEVFDNCPAIVYLPSEITSVPKNWEDSYSNKFMLPVSECISSTTISNGHAVNIGFSWTPKSVVVQDTAWRVGKSFADSKIVNLSDISKEYASQFIWMGLKNDSMEDYVWSDSCLLGSDAYACMKSTSGLLQIVRVDTISRLAKPYNYSIKVGGILDDSLFAGVKDFMKKNSFKIIDFSETEFQLNDEWTRQPISVSSLNEFYFPKNQDIKYNLIGAFENASYLKYIDMSNLPALSSLEKCFYECRALTNIKLNTTQDTNRINLEKAFYNCKSLTQIENLETYGPITDLNSAFFGCKSLISLSFPSIRNDNLIEMDYVFNGCYSLSAINGLDSFTNITSLFSTFKACTALDTIRLGTDINNVDMCSRPFENCNALIYLPDTVETLDQSMENFSSHFILPIKKTCWAIDDSAIIIKQYPKCCEMQDTLWHCFMEDKDTLVENLTDEILSKCLRVKCGLKNEKMDDYCWSAPFYTKELEVPYIVLSEVAAKKDDGYWEYRVYDTTLGVTIPIDSINDSTLKDAYSIYLYGKNDDSTLSIIKNALALNKDLAIFSFKNAELDIKNGLDSFFSGKTHLYNVEFSSEEYSNPVSLYRTFSKTGLSSIDLSSFANITDMNFAFFGCDYLSTVKFSDKENNNEVSFVQAFTGCPIDSLDLSSFSRISDLTQTFFNASALKHMRYLKFSDKENDLSVSMFQTFGGVSFDMTEIINFDKFTNVSNYMATFQGCNFFDETRLDTLRFGTDPNKIPEDSLTWALAMSSKIGVKYLPDGVDTLPKKWHGYHDFVVPIYADSLNWSTDSLLENILNMPELSPSYAYIADTTRYLILKEYMNEWLTAFGFSTSSLRSKLKVDYLIFDPDTMEIADYKDYALVCVVSNPKFKTLVYKINVAELQEAADVDDIDNRNILIINDNNGISIFSEINYSIEIVNALGMTVFKGDTNENSLHIPLPSGIYFVNSNGVLLKKIIVNNSQGSM